jgi:hypothetical protein
MVDVSRWALALALCVGLVAPVHAQSRAGIQGVARFVGRDAAGNAVDTIVQLAKGTRVRFSNAEVPSENSILGLADFSSRPVRYSELQPWASRIIRYTVSEERSAVVRDALGRSVPPPAYRIVRTDQHRSLAGVACTVYLGMATDGAAGRACVADSIGMHQLRLSVDHPALVDSVAVRWHALFRQRPWPAGIVSLETLTDTGWRSELTLIELTRRAITDTELAIPAHFGRLTLTSLLRGGGADSTRSLPRALKPRPKGR